jgi:hypothetical protein
MAYSSRFIAGRKPLLLWRLWFTVVCMLVNASHLPTDPLRRAAVQELVSKLPAYTGDEWLGNEVCQGRIYDKGYSPGSDLCHWLIWKLGCRDSRVLCRDIPEKKMAWDRNGIQRLVWGSQRLAAWKPFLLGHTPNPGDIIYLGAPNKGEPHCLCVLLWTIGEEWVVADANQTDAYGEPCALIVCSPFAGYHLSFAGQTKQVNGWIDITLLDLRATDSP